MKMPAVPARRLRFQRQIALAPAEIKPGITQNYQKIVPRGLPLPAERLDALKMSVRVSRQPDYASASCGEAGFSPVYPGSARKAIKTCGRSKINSGK